VVISKIEPHGTARFNISQQAKPPRYSLGILSKTSCAFSANGFNFFDFFLIQSMDFIILLFSGNAIYPIHYPIEVESILWNATTSLLHGRFNGTTVVKGPGLAVEYSESLWPQMRFKLMQKRELQV
jgi:hypothetical protein